MCGRYAFHSPRELTQQLFSLPDDSAAVAARWNISPGTDIPVVRTGTDGRRELVSLRWGLVPSWAKDRTIGQRLVNARAETIAEKPAFRAAFKRRRCLVPADGYYEWQAVSGGKQPYYVRSQAGQPFAIAALWENWIDRASGETLESCVLMTCEAAGIVKAIHARMPILVPPDAYAAWLDPAGDAVATLGRLLSAGHGIALEAHPVSKRVNSPRNEGPELTNPDAREPDLLG